MTDAVVTESLTKVFRGGRRAVDSVTLRIPKGVVYGLVGPNGAGKTTLMRCMLGLASITSGRVELLGVADIPTALARTGALVEEPKFHGFLTGTENLEIIAQLRGIAASPAIPEALDRVGLSARAGERVRQYSLGMRQRLAIARCLLANPDLLVLDEPANGLDPDGIREMRELVQSLAQDGRTVMVSSHQLGDLERICDHVGVIVDGKMLTSGPIAHLREDAHGVRIGCSDPSRAMILLHDRNASRDGDDITIPLHGNSMSEIEAIIASLVRDGIGIHRVQPPAHESLEALYLRLVRGAKSGSAIT